MKMIKILIFLLICTSEFGLSSAPRPFRLGEILSAEISRNKVTIKNFFAADYSLNIKYYAYALVACKLDKGRSISIYDFKLEFKNKKYKCIAIRSGSKPFDTKNWQFTKTSPNTIYSLLFIINSEELGNAKKTLSARLFYTLHNSGQVNYDLPFNFVNYTDLTEVDKIPKNGTFPKIEIKTGKMLSKKKSKATTTPSSSTQ